MRVAVEIGMRDTKKIRLVRGLTKGLFYVKQGESHLGLIYRDWKGLWTVSHDHVAMTFKFKKDAIEHFAQIFGAR